MTANSEMFTRWSMLTKPRYNAIFFSAAVTCKNWIVTVSSSSCRAISTDIPDPLAPSLPIIHCFQQVLRATPCIFTELLYVDSSWSPCFCSVMCRGPLEYLTNDSSLLLQQCPAYLVRLIWTVFVMGGSWL